MCETRFRKALALCAGVAVIVSLSSAAFAEVIVWDFNNPQAQPPTIQQIQEAGGLQVGDKLFTDFLVTPTPVPAGLIGSSPNAQTIVVSGILVGQDYGIQFNGPWLAGPGVAINTTIGFKVAIAPQWAGQYYIKDNTLALTASNVTASDGIVNVIENVFDGPPPLANRVASKSVYDTLTMSQLIDHQEFAPLSEIWIRKDITLVGGSGISHLSEFTQTFSQVVVPEPGTFSLLAAGLLGLAIHRWRRRRPTDIRLGNAV